MGNIKIITLSDGSIRYKATLIRDKKAYRATFETEEEARKWLKKTHRRWLDRKIQKKMIEDEQEQAIEQEEPKKDIVESYPLQMLVDTINYVMNEQLLLNSKVDRINDHLRAI